MGLYLPNKGDLSQTVLFHPQGDAMSTITCITLREIEDARTQLVLQNISKSFSLSEEEYLRAGGSKT